MKEFFATLLAFPLLILVLMGSFGTIITVNNPNNRENFHRIEFKSKEVKPVRLYNSVTGLEIDIHKRSGDLVRKLTEKPINNPGNLRDRNGEFQNFKTKKEGYQALVKDIKIKLSGDSPMMKAKLGKNYKPTLKNIIKVYAPETENNTKHYIKFVSTNSKLNPNKVLKVSDVKLIIPHIITMEKGHSGAKIYKQFAGK